MLKFVKILAKDLPQDSGPCPFQIYLRSKGASDFELAVGANIPFTEDTLVYLQQQEKLGAVIAVSEGQKLTFLEHVKVSEEQVWQEGLDNCRYLQESVVEHVSDQEIVKEVEKIVKQHKEEKKKQEEEREQEQGKQEVDKEISQKTQTAEKEEISRLLGDDLTAKLKSCIESDNFLEIIEHARAEIMEELTVNISITVSNARFLVEQVLTVDNLDNRITVLTYYLARQSGIKDKTEIADLLVAAILHDIGLTQIDAELFERATIGYSDSDQSQYRNHLGLANHLIRKSGAKISRRALRIILEHHEQLDGSGFPDSKTDQALHPLSGFLAIVDHAVHYAEGKLSGRKVKLNSVVKMIAQGGSGDPAMLVQFDQPIANSFAGIFGVEI